MKKDIEEARRYLTMASDEGDSLAEDLLSELEENYPSKQTG